MHRCSPLPCIRFLSLIFANDECSAVAHLTQQVCNQEVMLLAIQVTIRTIC